MFAADALEAVFEFVDGSRPSEVRSVPVKVVQGPGGPDFGLFIVLELPFVVLGELDVRLRIVSGHGCEPELPGVGGFLPAALALLQAGQPGKYLGAVGLRRCGLEGAAIGFFGQYRVLHLFIGNGEGEPVLSVQGRSLGVIAVVVECQGEMGGEADHRDDVFAVVVEDALHFGGIAGADVIRIELGDEVAGDVAFGALVLEHGLFQVGQPAALKPPAPETAGGEQQVEVRRAGLQQWGVQR